MTIIKKIVAAAVADESLDSYELISILGDFHFVILALRFEY